MNNFILFFYRYPLIHKIVLALFMYGLVQSQIQMKPKLQKILSKICMIQKDLVFKSSMKARNQIISFGLALAAENHMILNLILCNMPDYFVVQTKKDTLLLVKNAVIFVRYVID